MQYRQKQFACFTFQFLIGSLKTDDLDKSGNHFIEFQFLIGSLKTRCAEVREIFYAGFNSS